jgi:predicted ATPase/signal transduction histidine kinase/tRNA A-37 threonylcarbamoyl transferase component Bud32
MSNTLVTLPGYRTFEQIYVGTRTLVYRGIRESDSYPVVIKLLRSEFPNFNELVQFRNQYTIAKNLDLPGVVRPLCLENYRNGYALIMEDFGGISLKDYVALLAAERQEVSGKLPICEFLSIAIQIVSTLDLLIRHRVIHKDIKPANILINPTTKKVKLIDFSIASLLPRETQTLTSLNVLEGTLAYLSPEQTGRMNRGIDYRSDFYSLGVTFFELLTGQLPFSSDDPMELVHCHIAKLPPSVHSLNADIPLVLSEIVKKLMAKNAEDRYQSALGLKYDLQTCLAELKETGKIEEFELGKRDLCDRFLIPEKLYGRETEVATLLAAFERVAASRASRSQAQPGNDLTEALPLGKSEAEIEAEPLGMGSQVEPGNELGELGKAELMLVAGFSGIGKTAVVNEVHKPIVRQRGYFIKGKFDQFQRNIPFSAFVQAFRDLMGQVLTESDAQIQHWKTKILSALGDQGQVIIEVIPELERIIGKQPPVGELSGTSAQNRFNLLFQKFIQVFTTKEHPLVIFLDDLQWADSASLKLMQLLMSETETRYLLLIGAYRDNEVSPAHPLILTLGEIQKADVTINTINLSPLNQTDLNHLIADTLSCSSALALPLTELVDLKTKGNPFFATQFIKSLQEDGFIAFNFEAGYWQCDIAKIRELSLNDDVVEFMALQLQKLPEVTQEVLKLAACIGNQFDLGTLSIVHEKSQIETAADLWKALQEGLIIPVSEIYKFFQDGEGEASSQLPITNYQLPSYKFLHDRVQQAAYSLIPEDRKKLTHLQIGRLLLMHIPEKEREEKIFEIVNQFNYGVELIAASAEKEELAQLNLIAAHKAKVSTAYLAACSYATVGAKLLAADSWDTQYDLTLALFREWAEVEYLNGDFERSQQLIRQVIDQAKWPVEKAEIHNLLILEYTTLNKFAEAIQAGREGLRLLGIDFTETDFRSAIQREMELTKENLGGREIADLADEPEISSPEKKVAVKLLANIQAPGYFYNMDVWALANVKCTNLLIEYGNCTEAPFGYTHYGIFNNIELEDYQTGYEFGCLGMKLLDRFNDLAQKCQVYMEFSYYINTWVKPAKLTQDIELQGYQAGVESGNLPWAGYTLAYGLFISIFRGEYIENMLEKISSCLVFGRKTKNQVVVDIALGCQLILLNLSRKTADKFTFNSAEIAEADLLEQSSLLTQYYIFKSQVLYLYGQPSEAFDWSLKAKKELGLIQGLISIADHNFYYSLILISLYPEVAAEKQQQYWEQLEANQKQMKIWADNCEANFLHKYLLVAAEMARLSNRQLEAMDLYDRAIQSARENEYVQNEALSNELTAKFYLEWGKDKIAQVYLIEAYYCYARWGAKAKVEDLEQRYPDLLAPILLREKINGNTSTTKSSISSETFTSTSGGGAALLDLTTVMKAAQTLSEEIVLEELLSTLMQVLIENAGAENGCLILPKDGKLVIEAIQTSCTTQANVLQSIPVESSSVVPVTAINYVWRTQKILVTTDVTSLNRFASDPYIIQQQPKSLLCSPILNRGKLIGIVYLENNLIAGAFTSDRINILNLLCTQAAISLENARLYQKSQEYAQQLEASLQQLQQTQLQMIQSEKMSALGNLVAGVAHEINNPVGFISGNINEATATVKDLINHLRLYQEKFDNPGEEIEQDALDIDLEYALSDLPKMLSSMKVGCDRIRNISTSLRTFSRADSGSKISANLHEGLDSTLMILQYRLKANETHPAIEVIKNYGEIPKVKCYFGQLNQVFMNIIANAIDAFEEVNYGRNFTEIQAHPNQIAIQTQLSADRQNVVIKIKDNGKGMSEEVKCCIFEHLFTTKGVGKGTGLGLSISRQIVEETHGGSLTCNSVLGEGTEFAIVLPIAA